MAEICCSQSGDCGDERMKIADLQLQAEEALKNDTTFQPVRGKKDLGGLYHLLHELPIEKLASAYICHDTLKMLGYTSRVTINKDTLKVWVGVPQFKGNTLPKKKMRMP
jgi:hypothetical protein